MPPAGVNDLSGINIIDTHGALLISGPVGGSQFMFTDHGAAAKILDLTPGHPAGSLQDWDFNAFAGAGNFEWDINNEPDLAGHGGALIRPGVIPLPGSSAVFGYAMPGHWLDAVKASRFHGIGLVVVEADGTRRTVEVER